MFTDKVLLFERSRELLDFPDVHRGHSRNIVSGSLSSYPISVQLTIDKALCYNQLAKLCIETKRRWKMGIGGWVAIGIVFCVVIVVVCVIAYRQGFKKGYEEGLREGWARAANIYSGH